MTLLKKNSLNYWEQWIKKRNRSGNPQILNANTIYILPSGFGLLYAVMLLTVFSGAINYQISAVFLMSFFLAIIGLVSAWEAHANLKSLSIKLISLEDAQQGDPVKVTLLIQSNKKMRFGLDFQIGSQHKIKLEKIPEEELQFILSIETTARGYFPMPRIQISSLYPFGLFRVWSYAYFEQHYYVYPQPKNPDFWPNPVAKHSNKTNFVPGDEEIYDLKQVENPWLQPNLIAWKTAAKGQGWYIKTMTNNEGDYWLFSLNDLTGDLETKLRNL
ncbi:MAG: hypothetical protein PSV35_07225, partial [bacterium]|nr:hypothetical protein [bacterium]